MEKTVRFTILRGYETKKCIHADWKLLQAVVKYKHVDPNQHKIKLIGSTVAMVTK